MKHFENVIIGFGKAGKTLAGSLAKHGQEVLVIEKDAQMYGGTCINVACLPTKNMIINAQRGVDYEKSLAIKNQLTSKLRNANYHKIADLDLVTVLNATASFIDNQTIEVTDESGREKITADKFFINTGSTPIIPAIDGIDSSRHVYTSREMLDADHQTQKLTILGSGPIGLEFASMYQQFGSAVTVLGHSDRILKNIDENIASMVEQDLISDGIDLKLKADLMQVNDTDDGVQLIYQQNGEKKVVDADALLVATGRRPNTDGLGLENTTIKIGSHGEILTNDILQTNVDHIWALGDVNGGPKFTYISLDDYRIVNNQLFGSKNKTLANRPVYSTTTFLNPSISTIGMTASQAALSGKSIKVLTLSAGAIPKAKVIGDDRGYLQAIVDNDSDEILGATIYAEESYETINLIALAMQTHTPATILRDQIYAHPTMTESFNDLFADL